MNFLPITLKPENSCIDLLLGSGSFLSGIMREGRRALFTRSALIRYPQIAIATAVIVVASWACLSISIPETMVMPSTLLGGMHPASIDLVFSVQNKLIAGMR